jgi:hypothetical protein
MRNVAEVFQTSTSNAVNAMTLSNHGASFGRPEAFRYFPSPKA